MFVKTQHENTVNMVVTKACTLIYKLKEDKFDLYQLNATVATSVEPIKKKKYVKKKT